jgi:MtrB/PioB family decaheme-associated outer membrane protein
MKHVISLLAILGATTAYAQTPPQPAPAQATTGTQVTGAVMPGVQQIDNSTNSSKFTEYRDSRDQFFLPRLALSIAEPTRGLFFTLSGSNVSRRDQTILIETGRAGVWNVQADWNEVPHNFSNKAVTPYNERAPGLFEVPATVPITFKKLATAAADTAGVLASDDLIAEYQRTFLHPTELRTQTNFGRFGASWTGSDVLSLGFTYDLRDKYGSKNTFGPIGDRPPRTLNIELAEPVDYRTNDLTFAAEHQGSGYQLRAEYLFSDFANAVDTLQWQNIYAAVVPGQTYDTWDRSVSLYGVRPLPPDNRYHNISTMIGVDMPFDSRVIASIGYGRLEQNESLLPYSYNADQLTTRPFPRTTADGSIDTLSFTADYVVNPVPRLNFRAFYRRYDLDNNTPSDRWQYVTSDTSNLNGTSSYVNKRVNIPDAYDRDNAGGDATWRLPARSTLNFGYEREAVGRVHREADTSENILRASWRTRAKRWVSVEARYLQGARDGGTYNNEVTHEGYWYAPSEANDNNNPLLTFDNHPDMRRFDVSDRLRRQFDFRLNLSPREDVALNAFVRYRNDDFDSDVTSSQPLSDTSLPDAAAETPGNQLGLLEDTRTRYGVDFFVQPTGRVMLNAFINHDRGTSFVKSIEFNENNKANPGAIATAELGPWTRAGSQWTAETKNRTWSTGFGTTLQIAPDRIAIVADYTASLAEVDVPYGGYGVTNWDGTPFPANHQFAFSTPPTVVENWHVVNLRLEYTLRAATIVAGYSFENYGLEDWQQSPTAPWVEAVGADTLLRDTSRSFQWGNRLFNLGTELAPGYTAHVGFVGLRYRF